MIGTRFWGFVAQGDKSYAHKVEQSFVITQAELVENQKQGGKGKSGNEGELVRVILNIQGTEFVISQLSLKNHSSKMKIPIEVGQQVDIKVEGSPKYMVHIIGYLLDDGPAGSPNAAGKSNKVASANGVQAKAQMELKKALADTAVALKNKQAEAVGGKKKKMSVPQVEVDEDIDDDDDMLEFGSSDDEEDDDEDLGEEEEDDNADDFGKGRAASSKQNPVVIQKAKKLNSKTFNFDDEEDDDDDEDLEEEEEDDDLEDMKILTTVTKAKKNGAAIMKNPSGDKAQLSAGAKTPDIKAQKAPSEKATPKKVTSKGGVIIEEVKVGEGSLAKLGKMASVYYVGRLKSNNKVFDKTQSGKGFPFRLGKGEVIKGWDIGVEGMKVGGKRKLTIPANLGYGKRGAPPDIPPGATLVFDVELKNVS